MPEHFYFLHIPKTAGTTFTYSILPQIFTAAETCPAFSYQQLMKIPPEELATYRLYRGHFYSFLENLIGTPLTCMTFLRDPVERVLSGYNYICREKTHFQYDAVSRMKGGIRDFIRDRDHVAPNFQVMALAFDIDPLRTVSNARLKQPGELNEDVVILKEMATRTATRQDLDTACRRLEQFAFVGITEQFHESVQLLCHTFGWGPLAPYETLNVAPQARLQRSQLAPDVLEEIIGMHELEIELYAFAKSLFLGRLEKMESRVAASTDQVL